MESTPIELCGAGGCASGSWLASDTPCGISGKEEEWPDGCKTRDEMVLGLLLLLLLGLVNVC